MERLPAILSRLVLALASLGLCLGALELFARVAAARQARADAAQLEGAALGRFHPLRGWENNPGASRRVARGGVAVTIAFNSRGLRGPERPYEKPPGIRRVLIVGDSFATGYYAEEPETVRARLESLLNAGAGATGTRYEVLNAGTPGYSTDQEYLLYQQEGRRYKPDLVVLFFYCNDLFFDRESFGTAGKPKPYFELASRTEIVLRNSPLPESALPAPPELTTPPAWRGSMALRLLAQRILVRPPLYRRLADWGILPPIGDDPPGDFLPFAFVGRQERWAVDDMWNRTRAILGNLAREVARDGGRLAVLYVPARFEASEQAWRWMRQRYRRPWARDAVWDRLEPTLEELHIPFVDTRTALREAERAGPPAYLAEDGHWNARGNAVAATVLAGALERLESAAAPAASTAGTVSTATR